MKKVTLEDIKDIAEYEKIRPHLRKYIIELKKARRVPVGNFLTFVFENRETVIYQIQEMMRAERMVDEQRIQDEIDVYNELVPADNELSATMFIEIDDLEVLRQILPKLVGIEAAVWLKLGDDQEIWGNFESGRSKEDKTSTVHYLKFSFTPEQVAALEDETKDLHLIVSHANYQGSAKMSPETRTSLIGDLSN
jgi:hypothetical protein